MANAPMKKGPWPVGINNRAEDYDMPAGTVRNAVNVDVDKAGWFKRRRGYTKVRSGANMRGGYSCPIGTFFIEGTSLYRLEDDDSATLLFSGVLGDYAAYEFFNETVYFSDGLITRCITADGVSNWGQDVPAQPNLNTTSGGLPAGTYMAAVTHVDSEGRESGASSVAVITTNAVGGIRVSGINNTTGARVYLSTTNGAELYLVASLAAGVTQFDAIMSSWLGDGKPLDTQYMTRPPAGRIIKEFNGRLYIADGKTIWYTEPYDLHKTKLGENYFQFPADVTIIEPTSNGLWVVADKTYWYQGTKPSDLRPVVRLNYGAIFGTSRVVPYTNDVLWYSERGVVVATEEGQVTNLQEDNVAVHTGTSGAALVREKDGSKQVITSIKGASISPLAATSFIEMEVIRKAGLE